MLLKIASTAEGLKCWIDFAVTQYFQMKKRMKSFRKNTFVHSLSLEVLINNGNITKERE